MVNDRLDGLVQSVVSMNDATRCTPDEVKLDEYRTRNQRRD